MYILLNMILFFNLLILLLINSYSSKEYKTIGDNDNDLFRLADSPEEVIEHIQGYHNKHGLSPNF